MDTTKHTPGPWVVDEVKTQVGRAFRIGSGEMLKAGKGCCIIYDDWRAPGTENERSANAQLIAQAPLMLETLERVLALSHWADDPNNALQRIESIVADALLRARSKE